MHYRPPRYWRTPTGALAQTNEYTSCPASCQQLPANEYTSFSSVCSNNATSGWRMGPKASAGMYTCSAGSTVLSSISCAVRLWAWGAASKHDADGTEPPGLQSVDVLCRIAPMAHTCGGAGGATKRWAQRTAHADPWAACMGQLSTLCDAMPCRSCYANKCVLLMSVPMHRLKAAPLS